jgi:hypothetical protein
MTARRGPAVAIALLAGALVAAGCGIGPGEDVGEVGLTVTRDFGAEPLLQRSLDVNESDTVMRVLDRSTDLVTRYGGGFVEAIDEEEAGRSGGRFWDWLYYVNGVEAAIGAAEYELRGGEAIWWDLRDWSAALRIPAVVGSWPHPFLDGYDGRRRAVTVDCRGGGQACGEVRARLREAGAPLGITGTASAIRVLVGPWGAVRQDAAAAQIEKGPQTSGVFADFVPGSGGFRLLGLDESGAVAQRFGPGAGLVAATRRHEAPPVWVVTGTSAAGVRAAADLLDEANLRDRYAVATENGAAVALPRPVR